MTTLLEEAFARAPQLPPKDQQALAAWILEELAAEAQWDKTFADSEAALGQLASETLADHEVDRGGAIR